MRHPAIFATIVAAFLPLAAIRAADSGETVPTIEQIRVWSLDLSSPEYAVRNRATRAIRRVGLRAIEPLAVAAESKEREAAFRAFHLLREFASCGVPQHEQAALEQLRSLASSDLRRVSSRAAEILEFRDNFVAGRAIDELRQLGADVRASYSGEGPSTRVALTSNWMGGEEGLKLLSRLKNVTWLSMEHSGVTDEAMWRLEGLDSLTFLYLGRTEITGKGVRHLKSLRGLRYLSLEGLNIGEQGMREVGKLHRLESLGLDGTNIGDESAPALSGLVNLRRLWLSRTLITDKALPHLSELKRLERLYLERTQVGGAGLSTLKQLPSLNYLSLKSVALDDEAMRNLGHLTTLQTLGLDQSSISDSALIHLKQMDQLQILWLSKTNIGDDGLLHLKDLPHLRTVFLHGAKVTTNGERRFIQHRRENDITRCSIHK